VTEFVQGSYELRVVTASEAREQANQLSVGDSYGKFVAEEELEVGL
jgi:hypothetical protein